MTTNNSDYKNAEVADLQVARITDTEIQLCGLSSKLIDTLNILDLSKELVIVKGKRGETLLRIQPFESSRELVGLDSVTMKNIGVERLGETIQLKKINIDEIENTDRVSLIISSILDNNKEVLSQEDTKQVIESRKEEISLYIHGLTFASGNFFSVKTEGDYTVDFIIKSDKKRFLIDNGTSIEFKLIRSEIEGLTWDDIGGLGKEIDQIREVVELPVKYPELFERINLDPPKGIILHGPPGTGKTMIGKALSTLLGFNLFFLDGGLLAGSGGAAQHMQVMFAQAKKHAPSIVFIDEIDALAPKRDKGGRGASTSDAAMVATLLTEMDGVKKNEGLIVIGATNRVDSIDNALRRPGRFGYEVFIGVPDEEGRKEILEIHLRNTPLDDINKKAIEKLAKITHGFVGADLAGMIRKGKFRAIRKIVPEIDKEVEITTEILENLKLKKKELRLASKEIKPSALREFTVEVPKVKWSQIGGLKKEVKLIKESVILPLKKPEKFKELGVDAPSGILLFGPPGCGKTLVAKAVATESNANFISIKGAELLSMWVGETERAVRELFARARQVSPCVIFVDEAETVGRARGTQGVNDHGVNENMLSQILMEMDGIEATDGLVIILATNRPDILDPALLRPGRIDRFIHIRPPNEEGRKTILKIHTKKKKLYKGAEATKKIDFKYLVEETNNFSGADIESLCREAGMDAIRNDADSITLEHFKEAFKLVGSSITKEMLTFYDAVEGRLHSRKTIKKDLPQYI